MIRFPVRNPVILSYSYENWAVSNEQYMQWIADGSGFSTRGATGLALSVRWFAAAAGRLFHKTFTENQQPRRCQRWTSLDWLHVLLSISVNLSAVNNGLITRQHDTLEETVRCYKQWVVSALLFCRHLSSPAHGESRTYADAALVPFLSLYN